MAKLIVILSLLTAKSFFDKVEYDTQGVYFPTEDLYRSIFEDEIGAKTSLCNESTSEENFQKFGMNILTSLPIRPEFQKKLYFKTL